MTIRKRTHDREDPEPIPILTVEQLGPKRELTPNGNLVCKDVPIARVGWMLYGPDELPIKDDLGQGYVRIQRDADALFDPETIGSFMGVAVTDDHPEDDVTPDNWKELSLGFSTTNVRRGEGEDKDILFADLIITDADLIKAINDGLREVSCGYDADYEQTGPSEGKQTKIIGNHIALVEKGRCGPRCAIGDSAPDQLIEGTKTMARTVIKQTTRRPTLTVDAQARLRKFIGDAEALLEETADPDQSDLANSDEGGATHIHIHAGGTSGQMDPPTGQPVNPTQDDGGADPAGGGDDPVEKRFQAIESSIAQLTAAVQQLVGGQGGTQDNDPDPNEVPADLEPEATNDSEDEGDKGKTNDEDLDDPTKADINTQAHKTGDSRAYASGYQRLLSAAEILVPGFRAPTFDASKPRKHTTDAMCKLRRRVLDTCYATAEGKDLIDRVAGGSYVPNKLDCQATALLFNAAATMKGELNNRKATADSHRVPDGQGNQPAPQARSLAALNEANAKFWASQKATA